MGRDPLYLRVCELLREECRLFAASSPDGRLLNLPGIVAAIVPATPDRSAFNWVAPEYPDALATHYQELEHAYAAAGVRAWTVWLDENEAGAAGFLAARGHRIDSRPVAMAAYLNDLDLAEAGDLDWSETSDPGVIGRINDRAFGFPPPAFEAVLNRWPSGDWRGYVARLAGEPVGAVLAHAIAGGDCGVSGVATVPEARGRGIARRLLSVALREAHACGAVSTSLQASPLGTAVYAGLGYRALGTLYMWERRTPPAGTGAEA